MEVIIFTVILGLGIGFFATQNGGLMSLYFGSFVLPNVPIYLAIGGAILLGLFIAWIFYVLQSLSSSMLLHKRESKLKEATRTIAQLTKSIHLLELDNARLKEKV